MILELGPLNLKKFKERKFNFIRMFFKIIFQNVKIFKLNHSENFIGFKCTSTEFTKYDLSSGIQKLSKNFNFSKIIVNFC